MVMSAAHSMEESVRIQIDLAGTHFRMRETVSVPQEPATPRQMVRLSLKLASMVSDSAAAALAAENHPVSCKKGCAACCRYLVHISEAEAYYLRDLVEQMPQPRRSEIRARFARALKQLEHAGLLDILRSCQILSLAEVRARAAEYAALQMPCPFLEDESCSIHPDRPVACREHLVMSPPENCARVDEVGVHPVRLPVSFFSALARFGVPLEAPTQYRWLPLVLALDWAETHPDISDPLPGPELLATLLRNLGVSARAARLSPE
jgi:Fe-S-cluster containining protein